MLHIVQGHNSSPPWLSSHANCYRSMVVGLPAEQAKKFVTLAAFLLTACYNEELYPVPVVPVPPAAPVRPAQPAQPPMAAPNQAVQDPGNIQGQQETHGVVNRSDCQKMAERFQQQGRRVTLVDIIRSKNPGATLQYICVFQGEDAEPGYYEDTRYR